LSSDTSVGGPNVPSGSRWLTKMSFSGRSGPSEEELRDADIVVVKEAGNRSNARHRLSWFVTAFRFPQ
jgi:hypothetical protein